MLKKTINVSGRDVEFASSAAIPRLYRLTFKRDIFRDLAKLEKSYEENGNPESSGLEIEDLEIFENVAFVMARHADPTIPANIDEWLDQFDMFSIYQVLPEILELWGDNLLTMSQSKKNS